LIYNSINKDETTQTSVCKEKILDTGSHIGYDTQGDYQMEKFVEQTLLYDFYGELLTERQQQVYESVVLEDFSLSEVAEELGISRQGVHDMIRRCNHTLEEYEKKLHLVEKFLCIKKQVQRISQIAEKYQDREITEISKEILEEL
jgi:predicted DNA-binding protein YlxM (UPF0122 family)